MIRTVGTRGFSGLFLRLILRRIEPRLTWLIDRLAIRANGGLHPKNVFGFRNEFFVSKLNADDVVLDVACGSGALLKRIEANVRSGVGIDLNPPAEAPISERVHWVRADVLAFDYSQLRESSPYTVAIFSHILEHLERPSELLRRVRAPRVLVCVPSEENWRAQIKIVYGVNHLSDPTHFCEYTRARLRAVLVESGYRVLEMGFNAEGEIVCEAVLSA